MKDTMQQEFERTPISFGDAKVEEAADPLMKKRRAGKAAKPITDAEAPELSEADKSLAKTAERFNKMKNDILATHTRATKELQRIHMVEERLKLKPGWGASVQTFIRDKTDVQIAAAAELYKTYMKANLFSDEAGEVKAENAVQYDEQSCTMSSATIAFDTEYKRYVKDDLGDFAKLKS